MHPRVIAERHDSAMKRLLAASQTFAGEEGGMDLVARLDRIGRTRSPAERQMRETEVLADLIEEVVNRPATSTGEVEPDGAIVDALLAEIEKVEGIGPKTIKSIRSHFDALDTLEVEPDD